MAQVFRPEYNYMESPAPGRTAVKLAAAVNAELGHMLVTDGGYGKVPAAAIAATGRMRGVVEVPADNTLGGLGAATAVCRPGVYCFANSAGNPCAQANVGALVYAESGLIVSTASGDGPKAGVLIEFDSSNPQGRPCKVALLCNDV